jgi:hypothetical protein
MLRSLIDRFTGKDAPVAAPVMANPDPRGPAGTRVHHEYFVADAADGNGQWAWLCRVYAQNGAASEERGLAPNPQVARDAALSWANVTKAGLRGAP